MKITRTVFGNYDLTIELTMEEMERAYRTVQNNYRLEDAKKHVTEYFFPNDYKPSAELLNQFRMQNGVDFDALTDPSSDLYLLQDIVDCYEDRQDCNVPENDMYEQIVGNYIQRNPLLSKFRVQEELIPSEIRESAVRELQEKHPSWSREDCLSDLRDYTDQDIQRGYCIFSEFYWDNPLSGALVVGKIDVLGRFETDSDAAKQAEKDGIKIIHDIEGLEDWTYVDTPENREICEKAMQATKQKPSLDAMIESTSAKQTDGTNKEVPAREDLSL